MRSRADVVSMVRKLNIEAREDICNELNAIIEEWYKEKIKRVGFLNVASMDIKQYLYTQKLDLMDRIWQFLLPEEVEEYKELLEGIEHLKKDFI